MRFRYQAVVVVAAAKVGCRQGSCESTFLQHVDLVLGAGYESNGRQSEYRYWRYVCIYVYLHSHRLYIRTYLTLYESALEVVCFRWIFWALPDFFSCFALPFNDWPLSAPSVSGCLSCRCFSILPFWIMMPGCSQNLMWTRFNLWTHVGYMGGS